MTVPRSAPQLEYPIPAPALETFLARLGYRFDDSALLGRALTHRSWCAEHSGFLSNERLEFLGDAVLGLIVTADIYSRIPDASEGHLSASASIGGVLSGAGRDGRRTRHRSGAAPRQG